MSLELPVTETQTQQVALEECNDQDISSQQLEALQNDDIQVFKGVARIGGAAVRFTHLVSPHAQEVTPVAISNGYCGSEGAYKRLAVETALRGRNVIYVRPPRSQSLRGVLDSKHRADVLRLQSQAVWAAARDGMQKLDSDQVDVYGHSMGGTTATAMASHKIGRVRNLILAGSAGLDGKSTLLSRAKILPRVARYDILESISDIRDETGVQMAFETGLHVFKRPLRTIREGVAVARLDIRQELDILQDSGTKVGIILFGRDGFFDAKDVIAANKYSTFNAFEIIPNVRHVYPQQQPEEHSYDIDAMLADMQQYREAKMIA